MQSGQAGPGIPPLTSQLQLTRYLPTSLCAVAKPTRLCSTMECGDVANLANQPSKSRVNKANRKTVAARYNIRVLRELEAVLLNDPEVDITTALSSAYSQKLQAFRRSGGSLFI